MPMLSKIAAKLHFHDHTFRREVSNPAPIPTSPPSGDVFAEPEATICVSYPPSSAALSAILTPSHSGSTRSTERSDSANSVRYMATNREEQVKRFEHVKQALLASLKQNTVPPDVINQCNDLLIETPRNTSILTLRAIAH